MTLYGIRNTPMPQKTLTFNTDTDDYNVPIV